MPDYFYRAFEERFYASREVIKALRRQYLGIIEPLRQLFPGASVFDVGCGRGEWLELMVEAGFAPLGVDLDDGMLRSCVELALPARKGDAVAYLESLPGESQALVTAFHVVEHVSSEQLKSIIANSLRVLKPGGLLIMETPNPENLVVATHNFYLDPTHRRPLPAPLLAFMATHAGFGRVATLRLQEEARLRKDAAPSLYDVLGGASPDVAIVAQKAGLQPAQEALFDFPFPSLQGVRLLELAQRYDAAALARGQSLVDALDTHFDAQEAQVRQLSEALATKFDRAMTDVAGRLEAQEAQVRQLREALATKFDRAMTDVAGRLEAQEAQVRQLSEALAAQSTMRADRAARELAAQIAALQAERKALRASWSWRITAPLRWAARPFMKGASRNHAPQQAGVPAPLRPLVAAMKQVLRDPQRSYRLNQRLMRYPTLHRWLVGLSKRAGIYPGPPSTASFRDDKRRQADSRGPAVRVAAETPSWARESAAEPNLPSDGTALASVLARPLVLTGRRLDEVFEELRGRVVASSEAAVLRQRPVSNAVNSNRGRAE